MLDNFIVGINGEKLNALPFQGKHDWKKNKNKEEKGKEECDDPGAQGSQNLQVLQTSGKASLLNCADIIVSKVAEEAEQE